MKLRIGTRGSKLALAQAQLVKEALEKAGSGITCELQILKTSGDDFSTGESSALPAEALKGLFVKEIEEALLKGAIDLAVHSAKDMETELPKGLALAAVLKREDPQDALVTKNGWTLEELPANAAVGASSLRRQAQLMRLRRDLEIRPIRGNVDTRLRKLDEGEYDALILAACGLKRLGLQGRVSQFLEPNQMLPAPGQGVLAVEIREDRLDLAQLLKAVDHTNSHWEMTAERSLLKAVGGSCLVPIGALARVDGENLTLTGAVLSPDGLKQVRKEISGPKNKAERLGMELASHLRAAGADRLLYSHWAQKTQGV